jgi:hypothetical protein
MQEASEPLVTTYQTTRCHNLEDHNLRSKAGLFNAAPVIYFSGALFYSAGFNVNQNFKEKIFLNNSMFQFFS